MGGRYSLLYAMHGFHFPNCFRGLVINEQAVSATSDPDAFTAQHRNSINTNEDSNIPRKGSMYSVEERSTCTSNAIMPGLMNSNGLQGVFDGSPVSVGGRTSVHEYISIFVSINTISVVSEHADCVLLKADLSYLAKALEIVAKAVPQASVERMGEL